MKYNKKEGKMPDRYIERILTIEEQLTRGVFRSAEDDSERKVNWRKLPLLEVLRARLGKEVDILHGQIYIFSLQDWRRAIRLYRECHRWCRKSFRDEYQPPNSFTVEWEDEGPPLRGHFKGYVFSGLLWRPLPKEIMSAVMRPAGSDRFRLPWFVGTGIFYKKGSPKNFVPGKRGGECFIFVDMGSGISKAKRGDHK
jgi:hypothetical protein